MLLKILYRLCNDREISKYTKAVSRQRLGKHIPAAIDTNTTIVQQQRNGIFYGLTGAVWGN
jgi:hypothetical protein